MKSIFYKYSGVAGFLLAGGGVAQVEKKSLTSHENI